MTAGKAASGACLIIVEGIGKGKQIPLDADKAVTIGRSGDCHIQIDARDLRASRRHARLIPAGARFELENLSTTNPTRVKDKPITKTRLANGQRFQIGETVFELQLPPKTASGKAKPGSLKWLRFGAAAIVLILILAFWLRQPAPDKETTAPPETTATSDLTPPTESSKVLPSPATLSSTARSSSAETAAGAAGREKADDLFRKGMFFYDTGRLKKAITNWEQALAADYDHPHARKWLLKAEEELQRLIDTHYQNALLDYKYLRYREALNGFRIVMEYTTDRQNERYISAAKHVLDLQEKLNQ